MDHQVLFDLALFIIKAKEGYLEIRLHWNASQYPTSKSTNENMKVCAQLSLKKEKIRRLSGARVLQTLSFTETVNLDLEVLMPWRKAEKVAHCRS